MAKEYAKHFYNSKAWERAREAALIRDHGLCQTPGCYKPAEEVHHIIHLSPENINDGSITINLDNLVSLCRDCHMRLHDQDRANGKQEGKLLPAIVFDGARPSPLLKK